MPPLMTDAQVKEVKKDLDALLLKASEYNMQLTGALTYMQHLGDMQMITFAPSHIPPVVITDILDIVKEQHAKTFKPIISMPWPTRAGQG